MTTENRPPTPELFFSAANAYQLSAALAAAVDLDVFTAIGEGKQKPAEIAARCQSSERGIRILCDYLTLSGFLSKEAGSYRLTRDSGVFLNQHSPAYVGGALEFLHSDMLRGGFEGLAQAVRSGGTTIQGDGTVSPENPIWVKFARAMAPLAAGSADVLAKSVDIAKNGKVRILDIAAGHGMFGIAFAKGNPAVEVTALDWAAVLDLAVANAKAAGMSDRYHTIAGSAFDVEYGGPYDLVLLTNILHHFDPAGCERLIKRVFDSLDKGGRAVTLEFVPDEGRISPPVSAAFSLMMLASTPSGDAYTFSEFDTMFKNAGFTRNELFAPPSLVEPFIISYK